mmetsp:Transcript_41101/g.85589  ORF Transcript_41101/g.85589 Transcript_41101/m.85589 type:complete len:82 (-) Transcript_41101:1028-1273(-)
MERCRAGKMAGGQCGHSTIFAKHIFETLKPSTVSYKRFLESREAILYNIAAGWQKLNSRHQHNVPRRQKCFDIDLPKIRHP